MSNKAGKDMLPEYNFSKGVRGKYYKAYHEGSNVAILEPEVVEEFPDSKSVNEALKQLLKIIQSHKKGNKHKA